MAFFAWILNLFDSFFPRKRQQAADAAREAREQFNASLQVRKLEPRRVLDGAFAADADALNLTGFTEGGADNENLTVTESGGNYEFTLAEGTWSGVDAQLNGGTGNGLSTLTIAKSVVDNLGTGVNIDGNAGLLELMFDDADFSALGGTLNIDNASAVTQNAATGLQVSTIDIGATSVDLSNNTTNDFDSFSAATTTGNISIRDIDDISILSITTPASVSLTVGGAITDGGDAQTDITAASAALRAVTGIGTDADDIDIATDGGAATFTLAASTDSGDIHISNVGSLTIGTVDTLVGVTILDPLDNNSGDDNITLTAASPVTVNSPIINADGGDITLTAMTNGDVTINANVQVTSEAVAGDDGQIIFIADAGNIVHNAGTVFTVGGENSSTSGQIRYDASGAGGGAADGGTVTIGDANAVNAAAEIISVNGNIDIDADPSAANATGVTISDMNADALLQATTGNINIDGTGVSDGTTSTNRGVLINSGSVVRSTGTGIGVGTIAITGTGGAGDENNDGVEIDGLSTRVRSVSGDITINGTAGSNMLAGSIRNRGVQISGGAAVSSTGTGANAALVTIIGTGGAGGDSNDGVLIASANTQVTSVDGNIAITGASNGTGTGNDGVEITNSAVVSSTGMTANAATITLIADTTGATARNLLIDATASVLASADVTLVANNMDILGTVNAGTSTVNIRQDVDGTLIALGGASADADAGTDTLGLSAAELSNITGNINIGDAMSGDISFNGTVDRTGQTVTLTTGGSIISESPAVTDDIVAATLTLNAVNNIGAAGNALEIADVTNLTFTVGGSVFIDGDGATNIADLNATFDPTPDAETYSLTNFNNITAFTASSNGTDLTLEQINVSFQTTIAVTSGDIIVQGGTTVLNADMTITTPDDIIIGDNDGTADENAFLFNAANVTLTLIADNDDSGAGAIIDGGDVINFAALDGSIRFLAASGIGGAAAIELRGTTGTANVAGISDTSGNIRLNMSGGATLNVASVTSNATTTNGLTTLGGVIELDNTADITSTATGTITTTAAANTGTASGAVDIDAAGTGTINLAGTIVTTGAANAAAGSVGGQVNVDSVDGTLSVAAINTSGGASTNAGSNGGNAATVTLNTGNANIITLTDNITLDGGTGDGGGGVNGDGALVTISDNAQIGANSITVSTQGNNAGGITFGGTISGDATTDRALTLDATGVANGGTISFGTVTNGTGTFLGAFSASTSGTGEISLDNNISTDVGTAAAGVTLTGNVEVGADVIIDTDQAGVGVATGGAIDLSGATVFADGNNIDLDLNTSAATTGGNVSLGTIDNTGATGFLNTLDVITTATTPGTTTLNSGVQLSDNGTATSSALNFTGGGDVIVSNTLIVNLTSSTNGVQAGSVNFDGSTISADTAGFDLTINTSHTDATAGDDGSDGGNVSNLASITNDGRQFLDRVRFLMNAVDTANDEDGTLSFSTTNAVLETSGSVGALGVVISGNVLIPAAGSLSINTNPTNTPLAQSGDVTLTNAQVDGAGQLSINTSGNGMAVIAGNVSLGDVGATTRLIGVTVNTQGSTTDGVLSFNDADGNGTAQIQVTTGNVDFSNVSTVNLNANTNIGSNPTAANEGNVLFQQVGGTLNSIGGARELTIDVRGTTTGTDDDGDITLPGTIGSAGNPFGSLTFLSDEGTITVGNDGAAAAIFATQTNGTHAIQHGSSTILTANTTINTVGGVADFSDTIFSSDGVAERSLTINTTDGAATAEGNIFFAGADNAGGNFLSALTLTVSDSNGDDGDITFINDSETTVSVQLDGGNVTSNGTIAGGARILVADNTTIDTESGDNSAAGNVDFHDTRIDQDGALASGFSTLTFNTNGSAGSDGNIDFGNFGATRRLGQFSAIADNGTITINGLTIQTTDNGGQNGDITLGSFTQLTMDTTIDSGGGNVNMQATDVFSSGTGPFDLDIVAGGGDVRLRNFTDRDTATVGTFVNNLTVNTGGGFLELNGNIDLEFDAVNDAEAASFTLIGATNIDVRIAANARIDTEQGGNQVGGAINLGTGNISASAANLTLDLDARGDGTTGGEISLGPITSTGGGRFLSTFNASTEGAAGTTGKINLDNNITTDDPGNVLGAAAGVTLIGRVEVLGSPQITTKDGNDNNAGFVDLRNAILFAEIAGATDLTINTSVTGTNNAGNVDLGLISNDTANASLLDNVTITSTTDVGSTPGVLTVRAGVTLDGNFDYTGGTATINGAGSITTNNTGFINIAATSGTSSDVIINGQISSASTSTGPGTAPIRITANDDIRFNTTGVAATNNGSLTTPGLVIATAIGGAIVDADAGVEDALITADNVVLRAATGIGTDAADIDTATSGGDPTLTLAAATDSGDINVRNVGSFTIGTVDTLVGVTILDLINNNSGNDNITLIAVSPMIVNAAVNNMDGGNILLAAQGTANTMAGVFNTADGDLQINANLTTTGGNGNVELLAGGDILQTTGTVSAVGTGTVTLSAGENFNAGTRQNGNANAALVMSDPAIINTEDGNIILRAPESVTLARVNADTDGDALVAGLNTSSTVLVTADFDGVGGGLLDGMGTIIDGRTTDEAANITAIGAALRAGSGVGDGVAGTDDIDSASTNSQTFTLAAATDSGDINIRNVGSFTIDTVNTLVGVTILDDVTIGSDAQDSGNDDITLIATSPEIINAAVVNNDGGDILLAAQGSTNTMAGVFNAADDDLQVNANVTSTGGGGNIELLAGGDVLQTTGTISAVGSGTVTVSAGENFNDGSRLNGNANAFFLMSDPAIINSEDGNITLRAPGNIGLARVNADTNADALTANLDTNSTVIVTADFDGVAGGLADGSGRITDNRTTDEAANITAIGAALRAGSGVGDGVAGTDDIDSASTNSQTFTLAAATDSGDINVRNVGSFTIGTVDTLVGVTILDLINNNSGNDNITLIAVSPMIVNAAVNNMDGGNILLAAQGTANTMAGVFNTADGDLQINANLTTTGGNGNVELLAGGDILQTTGTVSAVGTGTVTLSAGENFNAGTRQNGNANAALVMSDPAIINTEDGNIILRAPESVTLARVNADTDGDALVAGLNTSSTVLVTADFDGVGGGLLDGMGTIIDGRTTDEAANITAIGAALRAGSGVGDGVAGTDDIDSASTNSQTFTLAAATDSGDINIRNVGSFTIDTVNTLVGVTILDDVTIGSDAQDSGNDDITLIAASPQIVNAPIDNRDGGDITLTALGTAATDDVTINANVQVTGDVAGTMNDGRITATAGADIIHNSGTVSTVGGEIVSNSGQITYDAEETIRIGDPTTGNAAAIVRTANGNIIMTADPTAPNTPNAMAITFSDAANTAANEVLVDTVNGNITIDGTGTDVPAGTTSDNRGVLIDSGSVVRSTGMGAGLGSITITGTGGNGINENDGVRLDGAGTRVASVDADVTIVGTGGATATGNMNQGVEITGAAQIDITGAADVIVNGTAGGGAITEGVLIVGGAVVGDNNLGNDATGFIILDANGGELRIDGSTVRTSAPAGATRRILLSGNLIQLDNSLVQSNSIGTGQGEIVAAPDTGTVNINLGGVANVAGFTLTQDELNQFEARIVRIGATSVVRNGVEEQILNQNGLNVVANGSVDLARPFATETQSTITVVGDFSADMEFATDLFQLRTRDDAHAVTTDNVVFNADVDLTSNGGGNFEVFAGHDITQNNTSQVTTASSGTDDLVNSSAVRDGDVFYSAERKILVNGNATNDDITTNDGEITLIANVNRQTTNNSIPTSGSNFRGVQLSGADLLTTDGRVLIEGRGGNVATDNQGVQIQGGSTVTSTNESITITGTGRGSSSNEGVRIINASVITAGLGIDITGTSEGTNFGNEGVEIADSSRVTSTGGNIDIDGTSTSTTTVDSEGVLITENSRVTATGNIVIDGTSNGAGGNNAGVEISSGAVVASTGGLINIDGTGGTSPTANNSEGVLITGANTQVNGVVDSIQITGTSNAAGDDNQGVEIDNGAAISSTGTGANAATITLNGTGANGDDDNDGVEIDGLSTRVRSVSGDITINGTAGSNMLAGSIRNRGVQISGGAAVSSSGLDNAAIGQTAATITINGTGGAGEDANDGVIITGGMTQVTSFDGNITINGTGRQTNNAGSEDNNLGVLISAGAVVSSTGDDTNNAAMRTAADISISGTGANGDLNNDGVEISGMMTRVTTIDGDITITGIAGSNTTAGSIQNRGVQISGAAVVSSTGTDDAANGQTAGTITIDGTAGAGEDFNEGAFITGAMTRVASVDGDITIDGTGLRTANGGVTEDSNRGVQIDTGATIESTGTNTVDPAMRTAALITISGTGASGDSNNDGIEIGGADARVSTVDGNLTLTGIGGSNGGAGDDNNGVRIDTGTVAVASNGVGTITIDGTGGAGDDNNRGVIITANGTQVTSQGADVAITGTGGSNAGADSNNNEGVRIDSGADVINAAAGSITITGTAGGGEDDNTGVFISGPNTTQITTVNGNIILNGIGATNGNADSDNNNGVRIDGGSLLQATGTGSINITGTGGAGDDNNQGIDIEDAGTIVRAVTGNIMLTGTGNSRGSAGNDDNEGIDIEEGAVIRTTGTGVNVGNIIINGTGNGFDNNEGAEVDDMGTLVTTVDGDITINGTANGTDDDNVGVQIEDFARVTTTGVGVNAGNITINGTSNGLDDDNTGVQIQTGARVTTNGVGPTAGNITLVGTGSGIDSGEGVQIQNMGTVVSTALGGGSISITGTTTATADNNEGVKIEDGAVVSSNTGTLTITGTGSGTNSNEGVQIESAGTLVTAVTGNIRITGNGTGTGSGNQGVEIEDGAIVSSTGVGAGAATITINGTGGNGTDNNDGVEIEDANTAITSIDGDITIDGTGRGTADNNNGVEISAGAIVRSSGTTNNAGAVNIDGTASTTGTDNNHGVLITGTGTLQRDLIVNGNFETGDFTGWTVQNTGFPVGGWTINNGTTNTFGSPFLPVPVINGNFDAIAEQAGPSQQTLTQDAIAEQAGPSQQTLTQTVTLPINITDADISWLDRIINGAGVFVDPSQEFRVLLDGNEVFSTNPGDPANQPGPNPRTFDVTALAQAIAGQTVQLQFISQNSIFFLNAALDNVDVTVTGDFRSEVSSVAGNININGIGGGTGSNKMGVGIDRGAVVSNSGDVTINGRADSTDGGNMTVGVAIENLGLVSATGGNIVVSGQTDSSGQDNAGVVVTTGGRVTGVNATSITINGFDSDVTNADVGVLLDGTSLLSTASGNITVNAAERSNVNGDLTMQSGAQILSVSGDVSLNSTNDVFISHVNAGTGSVFVTADSAVDPLVFFDADGNPINIARNNLGGIIDSNDNNNDVDGDPNNPVFDPLVLNIIGAAASLDAAEGVGGGTTSADPLDIDTSLRDAPTGTLAVLNTTAGSVNVTNFGGGLLTIGTVNGIVGVTNNAAGTDIVVTNNSPLTIAADVTNNSGGNITVSANAPGDLGIAANVAVNGGVGNIVLNGGSNVNFLTGGNTISTVAIDSTIDINALTGNVTGDFRNDDSTTTIQTPSGIARRGKPFIGLGPDAVPQIDIFGQTSLTAQVGVAGETNLLVTIDWGDSTPPTDPLAGWADDPTDQRSTTYIVDAGTHTFFHLYLQNPSANQADPIPITFDFEHDASISVDGFLSTTIVDFTIDSGDTVAETPGTGFGATVFQFDSGAPALSFPESSAAIDTGILSETSTLEEATDSGTVTAGESTVADAEKLVLRLTLPSGETKPDFALPREILEDSEQIKKLWKRLPDGRYQIILIREDGTKRVVLTVEVRGGRALIRDNTPDNQQDSTNNDKDQPNSQNGNGAAEAKQNDEGSNEMSRVDEQPLPLSPPNAETAPVDADATLPTSIDSESEEELENEIGSELIEIKVESDVTERRPAVSAAALVGSAIAYRSLRRGSSAHGSWEERVEHALKSSDQRSLGRAARLRRQLLR